jgi:hypothetical protein
MSEVDPQPDMSGLLTPGMKAERELTRRVNAAVLRDVHLLDDLPAVAKQLIETRVSIRGRRPGC